MSGSPQRLVNENGHGKDMERDKFYLIGKSHGILPFFFFLLFFPFLFFKAVQSTLPRPIYLEFYQLCPKILQGSKSPDFPGDLRIFADFSQISLITSFYEKTPDFW